MTIEEINYRILHADDRHSAIRRERIRYAFIYYLVDPRDGRPFYVGKTHNPEGRLKHHLKIWKSNNFYLQMRVHDLYRNGLNCQMRIVEIVKHVAWSERRVLRRESFHIRELSKEGEKICNKVNNPRTKYRNIDGAHVAPK